MTDKELVAEYLNGDENALNTLIVRYLRPVYSFVYRMIGSPDEANDITQDTFLKVWKNLGKYDSEKSFKTWLFVIAKNTTFDHLKKRKEIALSALESDNDEISFADNIQGGESPEEEFIRSTDALRLQSAIGDLPENYRAVVILKGMEELTFEEISNIIGRPLNTVKSQYRRALVLLKESLSAPK